MKRVLSLAILALLPLTASADDTLPKTAQTFEVAGRHGLLHGLLEAVDMAQRQHFTQRHGGQREQAADAVNQHCGKRVGLVGGVAGKVERLDGIAAELGHGGVRPAFQALPAITLPATARKVA